MNIQSHLIPYLNQEEDNTPLSAQLEKLISVLDLTLLDLSASEEAILKLCHSATTPYGTVAAVCIYPQFIPIAQQYLRETPIKIASVANFPSGNARLEDTLKQIHTALAFGAHEMDVVFPYFLYKKGKKAESFEYLQACQTTCQDLSIKVILEISEFSINEIYTLSTELIAQGVDFLKTSTGTTQQGATLEGAAAMLLAIKSSHTPTGFKASGGIKEVSQALAYMDLAKKILGEEGVNANHFRIGASKLLDSILKALPASLTLHNHNQ